MTNEMQDARSSQYRIVGSNGDTVYSGDMEGVALFAHNQTVGDLDLLSNLGLALKHIQVALEAAPDNEMLESALSALEDAYAVELDDEDEDEEPDEDEEDDVE